MQARKVNTFWGPIEPPGQAGCLFYIYTTGQLVGNIFKVTRGLPITWASTWMRPPWERTVSREWMWDSEVKYSLVLHPYVK